VKRSRLTKHGDHPSRAQTAFCSALLRIVIQAWGLEIARPGIGGRGRFEVDSGQRQKKKGVSVGSRPCLPGRLVLCHKIGYRRFRPTVRQPGGPRTFQCVVQGSVVGRGRCQVALQSCRIGHPRRIGIGPRRRVDAPPEIITHFLISNAFGRGGQRAAIGSGNSLSAEGQRGANPAGPGRTEAHSTLYGVK